MEVSFIWDDITAYHLDNQAGTNVVNPIIWVNYNISLTWIKAHLGMISLINYDSSEVAVRSL